MMGLGKITRDVGKVGAAIEVARLTILTARAFCRVIKGKGGGASTDAVPSENAPPPTA